MGKIRISGTGCALADNLYSGIDFNSKAFKKYFSQKPGDGGLAPGALVFTEEFQEFAGVPFSQFLNEITGGKAPDGFNVGGPSLVSLIHCSQLTANDEIEIQFFGAVGQDTVGEQILDKMQGFDMDLSNYKVFPDPSPVTEVFSDPDFHDGAGERIFINNIGAAWKLTPDDLGETFFESDITVFGGTALVPQIHDHLTELLQKAKDLGRTTVVNTVYDFRNEKKSPGQPWPLGQSDESYRCIDLLIVDLEEGQKLSGQNKIQDALQFFADQGTSAVVITHGAEPVFCYSDGRLFQPLDTTTMPISQKIGEELRAQRPDGDTTGCGDNFVGGVLGSLAQQMSQSKGTAPDLRRAVAWGVVSGGFACFYMGGTYFEKQRGEKRAILDGYFDAYRQQIGL